MTLVLGKQDKSWTPHLLVGGIVLQLFTLLVVTIVFGKVEALTRLGTPTLVQLADGRSVRVQPLGQYERSPEAIQRFVGDTLTLMFAWDGLKPPANLQEAKNPVPDPGVRVGQRRISTGAWQSGFALSEEFRVPFLEKLAELTPPALFDRGNVRVSLIVTHLSEPKRTGEGTWSTDMVANLIFFEGSNVGRAIPMNKTLHVRAVDTLPLRSHASGVEQTIYQMRMAGLEIFHIEDFEV